MEKSKHLMGVTMQEPGVSKMVAVDVEEAIKLAATA
jgi:chromosome segregation protein